MTDPLQMVQTKGSRLKNNNTSYEVVVFNNRKKSAHKSEIQSKSENTKEGVEFDIKQATKDVIKLGAKGFYQRRRDRTLKSFAVELGAKLEKRRYHNYKEFKEIKRIQREHKEKRVNLLKECSDLAALNRLKRTYKPKKKSDISILNSYGKRK